MPLLTRVLSKEGMGMYSLYQVTMQLIIPIFSLSIDYAINISYFKLKDKEFIRYQSTGIYLSLLLFAFFTLITIIFIHPLSHLFGLSPQMLMLTILVILLQYFNTIRLNLWQAQQKPLQYGLFAIPLTLSKNVFALILILSLGYGWEGIIWGNLAGNAFLFIVAVYTYTKAHYLQWCFSLKDAIDQVKTSISISVHRISAWFSTSINRIIINALLGTAATGSFGVGTVFATIVTVLEDAANNAYWPYLYRKLQNYDDNSKKSVVKLIAIYYIAFIVIGCFIGLAGYLFVGVVFGLQYEDTKVFIFPLVLSAIMNGLYKLHVNIIFFTKKTYIVARNTIICAIANIGVAYVFIKFYGLTGAAYAALLIQFLLYVLTLLSGNKLYPLPWKSLLYNKDK